jgi:alpha-galactosidase
MHVGPLPPQCAALVNISANNEEMAVNASLTGDPRMVFHSLCYDPLTSAVCSLEEIKSMTQEMLDINKEYLPQFSTLKL